MWADEQLQGFEEFDDDWRAGVVLQGATAQSEPTLRTVRQRWTTQPRQTLVLAVEASAVHERELRTVVCTEEDACTEVVELARVKRSRAQRRDARGCWPRGLVSCRQALVAQRRQRR
jgi:hypothetical protein